MTHGDDEYSDQRALPYTLSTGLAVVAVVVLQLKAWCESVVEASSASKLTMASIQQVQEQIEA